MMFNRSSGVLMHISSLGGKYGCGTFGTAAKLFIDFLKKCDYKIWQILPLSPVDECGSPYKSVSAFAGNPYFIDPDELFAMGLVSEDELRKCEYHSPYGIDFDFLKRTRTSLLKAAYANAGADIMAKCEAFAKDNAYWLDGYADFMAKKDGSDALHHKFVQYLFNKQWLEIKKYANENEIAIIGDMPLYVSDDSSDFAENKELFMTDENGRLTCVAGVPPDYFAKDGQLWGNPLYNWDVMKRDGYSWWMMRIKRCLELYDAVRIDHFRGLSAFYAIPTGEIALNGKWLDGPANDFFDQLNKSFPDAKIIAEDLGTLDDGVYELLDYSGLYGMRVFQFGFDGDEENRHLTKNYPKKSIAYTGTHDNNTLLGWVWEMNESARNFVLGHIEFSGDWGKGGRDNTICKSIIKMVWESDADIAIVPIQDLLGFGSDTRMNTPGTTCNNWQYRITQQNLDEIDVEFFSRLNINSGRNT
ncbi:MAG: 4-alpha-glucanotransferase, partial [Clostridia bacterium]|nr:4-alpha-glucanotransferase [Clostridia bacterium]